MASTDIIIAAFSMNYTVSETVTPNGLTIVNFSNLFTLIEKEDGSFHWGSNIALPLELVSMLSSTYRENIDVIELLEFIHAY